MITPFLMFEGQAEEAINFYTALFPSSEIISITHYGPDEPGEEGTVMHAFFSLNGQKYMCIDSNVEHAFSFTPALSLYVTCDTEDEVDELFKELTQGGEILMPLAAYPFSEKYAWVNDRYGVSWQLSLVDGN